MKPSCQIVLNLLRDHDSVTTHDFLVAGAGSRFGARIGELRKLGYVISETRLKGGPRGSRYVLIAEPDLPRPEASAEGKREAVLACKGTSGRPAPSFDVGREGAAVAHPLRGTAAALSPSAGVERADVPLERDREHRGTLAPRDNGVDVGSLNFDGALFAADIGRAA